MTATLALASALLLSQIERTDHSIPMDRTTRTIAEVAGGLLGGGLGEAGGILGVCAASGELQRGSCLYSAIIGFPLGLLVGTGAGVVLLGDLLGGHGSAFLGLLACVGGTALSLVVAIFNPYLGVLGGPFITTTLAVLAYEGTHDPYAARAVPRSPPLGLSVSVRADPRSPGLMLRGAF